MPAMKLKVELIGVGAINNAYIYMERMPSKSNSHIVIPIMLNPKNSARKEWSNSSITIDVVGSLDFQFYVHAFRGTGWTFKLSQWVNSRWRNIYEIDGETGSRPSQGRNVSIITDSIN